VLIGTGMLIAGVAFLLATRFTTGEAQGEHVAITFDSDCGREAIEARLLDYGLESDWAGSTLATQLPGMPGDEGVPAALATRGELVVKVDGAPTPVRVLNAGVQVSLSGTAVSLLVLETALPSRGVTAFLDGAPLEIEAVNGEELQIAARGADSTAALRAATDRVVQIRHPLPCAVTVAEVHPEGRTAPG
jgi:hypothetical protein